jgi:hypothetical protein
MKKFAIISDSNRVSNIIISETPPSGSTSVELTGSNLPSNGYGYNNSTFYPPITSKWNQTSLPSDAEQIPGVGIVLSPSTSYSASIKIDLSRELNGTLPSSILIPNSNIDISNFTHNNEDFTITFDVVTSSIASTGDHELKYSGVVTDSFGWEWDLPFTPISIT